MHTVNSSFFHQELCVNSTMRLKCFMSTGEAQLKPHPSKEISWEFHTFLLPWPDVGQMLMRRHQGGQTMQSILGIVFPYKILESPFLQEKEMGEREMKQSLFQLSASFLTLISKGEYVYVYIYCRIVSALHYLKTFQINCQGNYRRIQVLPYVNFQSL